jgi:hypothetical protein
MIVLTSDEVQPRQHTRCIVREREGIPRRRNRDIGRAKLPERRRVARGDPNVGDGEPASTPEPASPGFEAALPLLLTILGIDREGPQP